MRKLVLLLVPVVIAIAGFAIQKKHTTEVKSMTVAENGKRVVLHTVPGLALRYMGESGNQKEAEYMLRAPSEVRDSVNRHSIVLENTSGKAIHALSIVYSFPRPGEDNAPISSIRTDSFQASFLGSDEPLMRASMSTGICFAAGNDGFDFKSGIRMLGAAIPVDHPAAAKLTPEQKEKRNNYFLSRLTQLDGLLAKSERYEIEIEGVIFEDGTSAGTNRKRFFEESSARIRGARSLLEEMAKLRQAGNTHAALIEAAKSRIIDFHVLLKPFGGDLSVASHDETFLFNQARTTVAHRFSSLPEDKGLKYLTYGENHWIVPIRVE